jgi:hypothetical protein
MMPYQGIYDLMACITMQEHPDTKGPQKTLDSGSNPE